MKIIKPGKTLASWLDADTIERKRIIERLEREDENREELAERKAKKSITRALGSLHLQHLRSEKVRASAANLIETVADWLDYGNFYSIDILAEEVKEWATDVIAQMKDMSRNGWEEAREWIEDGADVEDFAEHFKDWADISEVLGWIQSHTLTISHANRTPEEKEKAKKALPYWIHLFNSILGE